MNGMEYLLVTLLLIVSRVGGFLATFPLFRSNTIPRLIKVALALSLSIAWLADFVQTSSAPMPPALSDHWVSYAIAVGRELIVGALLGFLLGLLFLPAQLAGAYLGQEMGFNMGGLTDPTTEATSNVFGDLLNAVAMLLFLAVDAHQLAIGALYSSFATMPLGHSLPDFSPSLVSTSFANAHRWGMELAAPMATGLFVITISIAMLMKISPQLNLFAIGLPLRIALGMLVALFFFPQTAQLLTQIFLRQRELLLQLGF